MASRSRDGSDSFDGYRGSSHRNSSFDITKKYKLPADPWHIQVRWETEGMIRIPGTAPKLWRTRLIHFTGIRRSAVGTNVATPEEVEADKFLVRKTEDDSKIQVVAMRLDIQIYEMEPSVYLVDFKCNGYETAEGHILEEKEVTSAFPFLDLVAKLILMLADGE